MKTKNVIGLTLMLVFASALFLNFGSEVGGYGGFAEARATGDNTHVVGTWVSEQPMRYDAHAGIFTFHMRDEAGEIRPVRYNQPKPPNFEDAENLVVQGTVKATAQGEIFVAEHILVKCPSKYNDARGLGEDAAAMDAADAS
jgi:cytochrome c-type biogenesis protein CcmE